MKKSFADRSPLEKTVVFFLFLASLAIVGLVERDIQRRRETEIRGPKLAWRAASLNALGALAYLGLGRRR